MLSEASDLYRGAVYYLPKERGWDSRCHPLNTPFRGNNCRYGLALKRQTIFNRRERLYCRIPRHSALYYLSVYWPYPPQHRGRALPFWVAE